MADAGETLVRTIFNRIKEIERFTYDADLALPLKTSKARVEQWKTRGTIPWENIVEYTRERQVSLEYLVNGHGPVRRAELLSAVADAGAIYRVKTDQDVIYRLAGDVHAASTTVLPPDKFKQALHLLHREYLDTGRYPSEEKISQLVKMAL
jgi:hypothetical protein